MKSQGAFRLCLSHPPQKAEKYQNSPKINRPTLFQQTSCKSTAKSAKICWKHRIRCSAKLSLVKRERERARALLGSNSFFPFSSLPHSNCALHCIALCIAVHCWGVSVVEALPVINIIPALSLFPPPACLLLTLLLLTSPCHSTAAGYPAASSS